jgi:hypothetical protein
MTQNSKVICPKVCHSLARGNLFHLPFLVCRLHAEIIYPQAVFNTLELHAKAAVEFALR